MIDSILSRHAQYFLCCYSLRSFTKASKELRISQSALSLSIKEFESKIGEVLFERGRGAGEIKPTEKAESLHAALTGIENDIRSKLQLGNAGLATPRIATVQSFARNHLFPILRTKGFLERSHIFIVRSAKALAAIDNKDIDLAFVLSVKHPIQDSSRCFEIKAEKIGVVGSKRKFSKISKAKQAKDLEDFPEVVGDRIYERLPESLKGRRNGIYVEDHYSARFLILEGYAFGNLQFDYFTPAELATLTTSKVANPSQGLKLFAVLRKGLSADSTEELLKLIHQCQNLFGEVAPV